MHYYIRKGRDYYTGEGFSPYERDAIEYGTKGEAEEEATELIEGDPSLGGRLTVMMNKF